MRKKLYCSEKLHMQYLQASEYRYTCKDIKQKFKV